MINISDGLWGKLGVRARVLLFTALFLSVGAVLINVFEARRMAAELQEDMVQEMDVTLSQLESAISYRAARGDFDAIPGRIEHIAHNRFVMHISWLDNRGSVFNATGDTVLPAFPEWFGKLLDLRFPDQTRTVESDGKHYGAVVVAFSPVTLENRVWQRWLRQTSLFLLYFGGVLLIIWFILRDSLRPLEGISMLARRFMAGDYQAKVPDYPHLAPEMRDTLKMVSQATDSVGTLLRSLSERRRAMDNAAIVVETDLHGTITYVNDKFCEISGYSREELLCKTHRFLNSGHHPDSFFEALWETVKGGEVWRGEVCNKTSSGELFWVDTTITPIIGGDGKPYKYVVVRFDITARKQAEDALRASELRQRHLAELQTAVLDALPASVAILDESGKVTAVNQAWKQFAFANELSDANFAIGTNYLQVCDSAQGEYCQEATFAADGIRAVINGRMKDFSMEYPCHVPGRQQWFRMVVVPLRAGDERGVVLMHLDVTERKLAELKIQVSREQLRQLSSYLQQAREEERGRIAREIHDELGGTLTALKMDIFWLARRLPQGLDPLLEKTDAMSVLVDAAVQTTRRICTELRPTILDDLGLVAAIEWQVREYEKRTGIECVLNLADGSIALDGDRSIAFFRILQESFTNIIRHARASRVEIVLHSDDNNVEMQIKDNGVGISEDKILNPLSHGIRGMIERAGNLGGRLTVSGSPGRGAVIKVRIPLPQAQRVEA